MNNNYKQLIKIALSIFSLFFLFLQPFSINAKESNFNHDKTGFELIGPHELISCDSCHIRGVFKGTPKNAKFAMFRGAR